MPARVIVPEATHVYEQITITTASGGHNRYLAA